MNVIERWWTNTPLRRCKAEAMTAPPRRSCNEMWFVGQRGDGAGDEVSGGGQRKMSQGVTTGVKRPPPEDELEAAPRFLLCRTGGALDEVYTIPVPAPTS